MAPHFECFVVAVVVLASLVDGDKAAAELDSGTVPTFLLLLLSLLLSVIKDIAEAELRLKSDGEAIWSAG